MWMLWTVIFVIWGLFSFIQIFAGWLDPVGESFTMVNYKNFNNLNWIGRVFCVLIFTILLGPVAIIAHIVMFLNWLFHLGMGEKE